MKGLLDKIYSKLVDLFRVKTQTNIKKVFSGEEILLKDLFNLFWERRKYLVFWMVAFAILGGIAGSSSVQEFEASTQIMSEVNIPDPRARGRISGLAALAGVDIAGQGSGGLTNPAFYPEVVQNEMFLIGLMEEKFYFKEYKKEISLIQFFWSYDDKNLVEHWFDDIRRGRLPKLSYKKKKIREIPEGGYGQSSYEPDSVYQTITLNGPQRRAIAMLRKAINVETNEAGLIVITVTMSEKLVAAQMTQVVLEKLIDFVVKNQTDKEQQNLDFIRRRTAIAKRNFEKAQEDLADFVDSNTAVISARVNIEKQKLQAEAGIATQIYRQLALQLEQNEIALQEKTPVYRVFTPTIVPPGPLPRQRYLTLVGFIFVGLVLAGVQIVVIILRNLIRS